MPKTVDSTLRLPQDLETRLAGLRPAGMSRHAQILQVLEDYAGGFDPQLILGFFELLDGEVSPDTFCPECNMEFGDKGVFIGFTADLKPFGPVCGLCATTE